MVYVGFILCGAQPRWAWSEQVNPGPPNTQNAPIGSLANNGVAAGQPTIGKSLPECNELSGPIPEEQPSATVTVNSATAWQPRGGVVIVAINTTPDATKGLIVRACFGWSKASPRDFFRKENLASFEQAFIVIRPADQSESPGITNVGVTVPKTLKSAGREVPRSGFGIVPVASMRLIGFNSSGKLFDVVRPVGVTSLWFAATTTVISLVIIVAFFHGIVRPRMAAQQTGMAAQKGGGPVESLAKLALELLSFRWLLHVVEGSNGQASLSAFQIFLWTMTVVASAVYVMVLSGNLLNVTPGTLILLGIAGGTSLFAAGSSALTITPDTPAPARPPQPRPKWSDLILGDDGRPDITRLQMLVFTVVSATFVLIQVLNTYVIPAIPDGYLILMGISNGIYVGRKYVPPSSSKP